ncbi:MAG TPA: DNA mismatch repair endonuclease MutL, partial [Nitrospirae bacterium]|nr:DNA mismatch repair endonuclease MutL [Nitrospirota bacterium]
MSGIKILSEILQNKIAAGEVIERPASIVKELVENSIDADSTDIRVDVLKGGKRLIRVSDNGTGMDREDTLLCFQKHATSKITGEDDLFRISTMGFRGEALSSIVSVSKVKLKTAPAGISEGTEIEITGGKVQSVRDVATMGTTLEIRDIFFNVPVRKRFLKTDHTELYHIIDCVTRAAIANPLTGFSLSDAGKKIMSLHPVRTLKERIAQIFGMEFMDGLMEVNLADENTGMSLEGFVSGQGNFRKRRSNQYLFLNGRPIMDISLRHAIYRAYEGVISGDEHPVFLILLNIDPERVDVNVHPSKREVRFLEKERIYDTLLISLRDILRKEVLPGNDTVKALYSYGENKIDSLKVSSGGGVYGIDRPEAVSQRDSETIWLPCNVEKTFLYIGDVFVAYADMDGFCIIDHHAAHERVLYEKFRKGTGVDSCGLLFPVQLRLGAKEYSVLLEYKDMLEKIGFDIDDFGGNTVIVRSIPGVVDQEGL